MFHSILVPLDRSAFAEQALPWAMTLSRRAQGQLDLVEVHSLYALEDRHAAWVPFDPAQDAERRKKEQLYLDATAQWAKSVGTIAATGTVLHGSATLPLTVADSLLERVERVKADLIVMATHGRGPMSRLGAGSVADELIRRAHVPVLLVRPGSSPAEFMPEPAVEHILIPLDGSPRAEQVLEPAGQMARLMEARCTLVRVVEVGVTSVDPSVLQDAEQYLRRIAARMQTDGLQIETRVVVSPDAAEAILKQAAAHSCDMIAIATHGRGGVQRLLLGSVADKLVQRAAAPILVYRPTSSNGAAG